MRAETKVFGTIALLLLLRLPAGAQEQKVDMRRSADRGAPARMIMATDDHKAFRLIRPTVGAIQIGLAEAGYFSGPVNGIMGPSTLEAMAAFQGAQGRAASGLPTLLDVLTLAGVDETALVEAFESRIDLTPRAMDMTNMAGPGEMSAMAGMGRTGMPGMEKMDNMEGMAAMGGTAGHQMVEEAPTELEGDPQEVKSLTLMVMPAMKMDNRHTASVRSVRDVVAGLQLLMAGQGRFDGPIDGFPEGEAFAGALRAFQVARGLGEDGSLNFATALALFGLDRETMTTKYADRLALSESPVAMDTGLLRESAGRFSSGAPSLRQESSPADTVRIEISQREFAFAPDTIRIPAGLPVTLVIRNEGVIPHGFNAGRDPGNGHFGEDLFEGVDVDGPMSAMTMEMTMEMDMGMDMGGGDHGQDDRGPMVLAQVGETMKLSFTLPESRRGVWNVSCFLAGHVEAGMHAVLIVE
ncbi:MAG: peptidoglycan-binding protein [Longimicrobiales bacterium]